MNDFCAECCATYEEINEAGLCESCERDDKSMRETDYLWEQSK